jgi:hypothetical protein
MMSSPATALFVFGYNLGGDSAGWLIEEIDSREQPEPNLISWFKEDRSGEGEEFTEALERMLKSLEVPGLEVVYHGYNLQESAIVLHREQVDSGATLPVDPAKLTALLADGTMVKALQDVVTYLGITPIQSQPEWLILVQH